MEGLIDCSSIKDFYERLANILSLNVIDRARRGLYRTYEAREDRLPFIRGRLEVDRLARKPWSVNLHCRYENHTADLVDNQILIWTLEKIARSGLCSNRTLPNVRKAYRVIQGFASSLPQKAQDCINRHYNRLNIDYRPMHALCRFFLENSGPIHETGDKTFLPFTVNMARLFERFVAEWMKKHLPSNLKLKYQEHIDLGSDVKFEIDMVIYDTLSGDPVFVLDTKYKTPDSSSSGDISQIVAYAEAKGCTDAFLIYPIPITKPVDTWVGAHRVRTLFFELDNDIEEAGGELLLRLGVLNEGNI